MRKRTSRVLRSAPVLAACCMVVALMVGAALSQDERVGAAPEGRAQFRIAVVDLGRVLRESQQWADCEQKRKTMLDTMNRTLRDLERQLLVLHSEYENLAPGTEAMAEKRKQIEEATREFQETEKRFQTDIAREYAASLHTMWTRITAVVERYAKDNGIDLVLKKHQQEVPQPVLMQTELLIARADVLYSHESLDVSEHIVALLNADYPVEIEVR